MSEKKELKISASRLKTKSSCSWVYYARYHLKLADDTNAGALMGTCCHTIFESLTLPRRRKLFDKVVEAGTIEKAAAIKFYVDKYLKKNKLAPDLFQKIDEMVMQGLKNDFFCEGGKIKGVELEFDLKGPGYRIYGLIDRLIEYEKNYQRIQDWKSSKKLFTDEELKDSIQAKMYSLYVRKTNPGAKPIVDFMMLQHPTDYVQRAKFSDAELDEFEEYLAEEYAAMANFTEEDARAGMAASKGFLPPSAGFAGRLMCGRANYPGEMKKDGSKELYYCKWKFPYSYFALCDEDGNVLKTSKKEDLVADESKGQYVIPKKYAGCPAHNR